MHFTCSNQKQLHSCGGRIIANHCNASQKCFKTEIDANLCCRILNESVVTSVEDWKIVYVSFLGRLAHVNSMSERMLLKDVLRYKNSIN